MDRSAADEATDSVTEQIADWAGGSKAAFGTDAKPLALGLACEAGVRAAHLARAGLGGPRDVIERRGGLADQCNGDHFDSGACQSIGQGWRPLSPGVDIERIPPCLSAHTSVDASTALMQSHRITPDQIVSVLCDVTPVVRANLTCDHPRSPREAQFSLPFAIATTALAGAPGLAHLSDDWLAQPRLQALARLPHLPRQLPDPGFPPFSDLQSGTDQ